MVQNSRRLNIEEMRSIAANRGGRCLSPEYLGSLTHLEWECSAGHRWRAVPNNVKRGTWCPVCARGRQGGNAYSVTIGGLREVAQSRGGECLSRKYLGMFVKHRWRCSEGHEWEAIADAVRRGSWCPTCSQRSQAHSIEYVRAFAAAQGWKCLSDRYETNQTKLEWECARGHRWEATFNYVQSHTYCPECMEQDHRAAGLAECQAVAASRGGRCLSTEFRGTRFFLQWECSRGHRWSARVAQVKSGSWCPTCNNVRRRLSLDEMRARVVARGGACLSKEYVTNHVKLRWRCRAGHEWDAAPSSIKAGTWCPRCAVRERRTYTIADMQRLAASKGGECLSEAYASNQAPLEWRCGEGHRWTASFRNVKRGFWCPECNALGKSALRESDPPAPLPPRTCVRRRSKEQLVADVHRIVQERGGELLSSQVASRDSVLRLRCSLGHVWQARVSSILSGHWCHACGRHSMEAAFRRRFGLVELDDADEVALWADTQGLVFVSAGKPCLGRTDFFRCPQAHLWEVSRPYSPLGSWCPACGARGEALGLGRIVR